MIGFTAQYSSFQKQGYIGLSIGAPYDSNITIFNDKSSIPLNYTTFVKGGEIFEYKLPISFRMAGTGKQVSGIEILSTRNISVVGLNYHSTSADGYLALPTNTLGLIYVAASYLPYNSYSRSTLAIISTYDNNAIIVLPAKNAVITYSGLFYDQGTPFYVTLEKLEALHISSTSDISGTIVFASKPVTVISGVDRAFPSGSSGSYDLLESFLLPTVLWGKRYILTTVGTIDKKQGDIFRIFAYENNTVVQTAYWTKVLLSGTYTELSLGKNLTSFVNCSKPCQVLQYIRGETIGGKSADTSMIILPSESQFLSYYRVVLPSGSQYHDSITVLIRNDYKDGLYMNGIKISGVRWKKVHGTEYVWTVVNVASSSVVTVYHSSAVKFGVLVFGWNNGVSYAYPGGFALHNISNGKG